MPRLAVSVLDLSPVVSGKTARDALLATVELARHAESLGYARYWVAEHHNAKSLACTSPEVVIGQIAAATSSIRVGSGGIMLPNHVPLKVAETFRTLAAFFPGRIDLGVGRAAGTDPRTARVLRRLKAGEEIPSSDDLGPELDALAGYLVENEPPRGPFAASIVAAPGGGYAPDLWILGSSVASGALAARVGLPFAYAHHFAPADAVDAVRAYRRAFRPSPGLARPRALVAVSALCAPTDGEAEILAESLVLSGLRRAQGLRDLPFPSPEEARAHVYDDTDRALVAGYRAGGFVGGPETVARTLRALAESAGVDEVMVTTEAHDFDARKRSYTLLAAAL